MLICLLKRRSAIALPVIAVVIATALAATLLYIASIGSFDPSKRAIRDPIEGRETQAVENPAPPQHPAFPLPTPNNISSSAGVNGNNSLAEQTSAKAPPAAFAFFAFLNSMRIM